MMSGLSYVYVSFFFFFKQKTAYEMRISDWSSDVCSSDLIVQRGIVIATGAESTRSLAQQGRAFQRKQLIPARCHILPGRRFATALCHTHSPLNLTRNADRPEPAVMPEPGNRACGWKLSTILPQSQTSCPEYRSNLPRRRGRRLGHLAMGKIEA